MPISHIISFTIFFSFFLFLVYLLISYFTFDDDDTRKRRDVVVARVSFLFSFSFSFAIWRLRDLRFFLFFPTRFFLLTSSVGYNVLSCNVPPSTNQPLFLFIQFHFFHLTASSYFIFPSFMIHQVARALYMLMCRKNIKGHFLFRRHFFRSIYLSLL
ncbi:hypothetical protein CPC08DRAFT_533072 [Agrocybe pediades]|nr:hypothetical protein CPC08DRAFT_533072 [Agrocybe pediades]